MRIAISFTTTSEVPKHLLHKVKQIEDRGYYHRGIPEFDHPYDWYEFVDKDGSYYTNYPDWQPRRYGRFYGYSGFDFDSKRIPTPVLSYLLAKIEQGETIYWRSSSTGKGIHILSKEHPTDGFLSKYEDQKRQEFTIKRGYEWFWKSKTKNMKKKVPRSYRLSKCRKYLFTRAKPWKIMTKIDVMRLYNYELRNHGRQLSRKKQYKL